MGQESEASPTHHTQCDVMLNDATRRDDGSARAWGPLDPSYVGGL